MKKHFRPTEKKKNGTQKRTKKNKRGGGKRIKRQREKNPNTGGS